MNICMLSHNVAWGGGTFNRCLPLATELARLGHRVTLVTTAPSARWRAGRQTHEGVAVVEFPALFPGRVRSGWDPVDLAQRLVAAVRNEFGRPDVIHGFDSRVTVILPALVLARQTGAPLVLDWADWWGRGGTIEERDTGKLVRLLVRVPETWFEEAFRTKAKRTTVISRALAERAISLGVAESSITVLPQGCDTRNIQPMEMGEARRRSGLPERVPIIGYSGTLLRSDGAQLLKDFAAIRRVDETAQLLLIGNPRLSLPDQPGLLRVGFVPRQLLSQYLGACDFFVLPLTDSIANRARWPSKINDYMAAGRATVATPVGDVADMIRTHQVGLVESVEDGAFASACLRLIGDPTESQSFGNNARVVAEKQLSWEQVSLSLLSVYQSARSDPGVHVRSNSSQAEPPLSGVNAAPTILD
jgi:glycosyltransferase involved in cell wall biosynthesis